MVIDTTMFAQLFMEIVKAHKKTYVRAQVVSGHESHANFRFPKYNRPVYFRFGNTDKVKEGGIELNEIEGINNCRDKILMKEIFKKNFIKSPRMFRTNPMRFPIVIKTREHSGGRGMRRANSVTDLPKKTDGLFFEEYVNCTVEYRIHVIGDRIFHIDTKSLKEGYSEHWIKNLGNGYRYVLTEQDLVPRMLREQAIKAVACLGLTFGAVDAGYNPDTEEFYIYEVNSAPGMRPTLQRVYNKVLAEYVEKKYGLEKIND